MATNKIELSLDEPMSYFESLGNAAPAVGLKSVSDEAVRLIKSIAELAKNDKIVRKYIVEPATSSSRQDDSDLNATLALAEELRKLYSDSNSLIRRLVEEEAVSVEGGKEIDKKYLGDVFRYLDVATTMVDGMRFMWEHDFLEKEGTNPAALKDYARAKVDGYNAVFQAGLVTNKALIGIGSGLDKTVTVKELHSLLELGEQAVRSQLGAYDALLFREFVQEAVGESEVGVPYEMGEN